MAFRPRTIRRRSTKTARRATPKPERFCDDTGKRRFTKVEALRALDDRQAGGWKGVDPVRPKREQRVYKCPLCHGWHLTSQEWRGRKRV